jgi:hypothetical protein
MNLSWKSWDQAQLGTLEKELGTLLGQVEDIDPRNVWRASRRLGECEKERARLDGKVADLTSTLTIQGFAVPIASEVEAASSGGPIPSPDLRSKQDLVVALGSMNQGLLFILHVQQQFQAVGSLIERRYAYVIAWLSLYVAVILGLAAIVLGFYPIWEAWHKTPERCPCEDVPAKRADAPPRLAVFPVRFSSNATGEAGHWSAGVVPGKPEEESLAFLMRSLHGCGDTTGRNVIRLTVVGFASSAEFKGRASEQSSALNLDAANRRADEVARILRRLRDGEGLTAQVVIETRPWSTYEAMVEHRPFNDRPTAARGQHDQEVFNRVVEVEMVDAGSCEVLSKK